MSLINDALKRATQAQTPGSAPASEPETPMRPAEPHGSVGLPVYFVPVLLFVICGAAYFLVQGWDGRRQRGLYPEPITVQAREVSSSGLPDTAAIGAREASAQPIPANRQFALNDSPSPDAARKVAEETEKPSFRLQGIFYRPSKPSAVVNSKTVYVGDLVEGGKIQAITRNSVTLVFEGETKVLTLP
jgi:hypothetical protein